MHSVVAVMGSPRKGDTYHLTQQIEKKMSNLGDVKFDYLWLRDADLQICRGCYACLWRGESHCPLEDEREEIERRLLGADGVIFASPVYAMGMTALLKNLLDRFAYAMHRPRFFDQKAMIVVSAGAAGIKKTQNAIAAVRHMGFDMSGGRVGLTMLPRPWTQAEQRRVQARTERAGRDFFEVLQRDRRPRPGLMDVAYFRIQQAVYKVNRNEQPADHRYFEERGWLDRSCRWYREARINPFYDLCARAVARAVRRRALARRNDLKREAEQSPQ